MYRVPLVLYNIDVGSVIHKVIGTRFSNLVLAVKGMFEMERAMCQLMGYRAVNSFLSSFMRCFGKQVAKLFTSWHVACGIMVTAMLQ
jgi:hypothetical protein